MFPQDPPSGAPQALAHLAASPLLAHLNSEQLAAVTLPAGHALILAGAGSGKTRVLTTRIAWLLQNGYATPGGVLAVTFTNKAAKEMVTRLSAMLPLNVRGMWIGTFHGLCNRLLRAHHRAAGLPQAFQILDTQDQLSAVKRLCKQYAVDDERFPPKQLAYFISGCKEEGLRPGSVPAHDSDARKKTEIYQLYEEQCQREGVVDFGELMLRSHELLRDNAAIRTHYQQRFAHILVDEFQDTSKLQYAWLKQFAGDTVDGRLQTRGSVIAVGDDDQSIYAFRGARVGNMTDFVREFDVRQQIKLEQNYRSHSNILDSANALISHNSQRLGKNLRTVQGPGEPVRVYEAETDTQEARWMVEEIGQLVQHNGFERMEIAVLYRSNAQSRVIESALFNAGMPYRVYGGLRFFERAEIKHALAYLRLLENPHDDTSFLRVLNFPPRGIGARSVELLQDTARTAGCSLHDGVGAVAGKAGANLAAFVAMVRALRAQTQGLSLREIVEQMLESTGLLEHFRSEKEGADRIENLQELVNAAESFAMQEGLGRDAVALPTQSPASQGLDPDSPAPDEPPARMPDGDTGEPLSPLAAFLSHAALEAGDNQARTGQDAVQLMTVHASKGLEFDGVFIGGMEEGLFPHENSANARDALEEERRLMYVAITRARKRLYLSRAHTRLLHGKTRYNAPSRFFDELPEGALKWITSRPRGWGIPDSGALNGYSSSAKDPFGFESKTPSSPPAVLQEAAPAQGLRAGMAVFHNRFGEGRVLSVEGRGDDARTQVHFPRHGTKWLVLSIAKLTVVDC
ncbi:DNA helicase II [Verminephrobacter aporrectodeae subsp. tuberculatae]|uniref:UvrD-helicase domain-containing protein n=1 Tax=Verminephrobacter aporrectodeae TaxID=1110389 RepID=UPI002238E525|nr:UvrD-helicase domain-containing protein [Verminephrobacter aporrectodeae]MCW5221138.1 DNA helicase II [Verminephrobacter aporrectodeae subsp. tuberculatae]MCW5290429.1 DNA helicase II [Verminephrobacter aporrectodeae subsp. tuberculatae]